MAGEPFGVFEDPAAGRVQGYTTQSGDQASGLYEAFENLFRGSEPFIRDRQRRYLALLEGREPVLDAGCGRGEFLDILREERIAYLGLDLDPDMVEHCRSKGHDRVELADINSYLEGCRDDSLGAVFSAQVIEHLPYEELLGFLQLSLRKLKPGGLLIAETVNPHSVPAMKTFWVDLTHKHPIFPEVALALCKIHGFASAYVFHPNGSGDVEADRFETGEYAVVARKGDA
jgi:O-antigen chain-terminating methyltransferase